MPRDKGARALEAFAYRYDETDPTLERFHVHKTIFPRDFLADFGFVTVADARPRRAARLELGGLLPVVEGTRERVLARRARRLHPGPAPASLGRAGADGTDGRAAGRRGAG